MAEPANGNGNGDRSLREKVSEAVRKEVRTILTVAASIVGALGASVPVVEHFHAARQAEIQQAVAAAVQPLSDRLLVLETQMRDMRQFARSNGYEPEPVALPPRRTAPATAMAASPAPSAGIVQP